ncbi:MAG: dockerin type 1 [Lachnospiraceae bacterium]|jgi:hypothetical protein|nr:dockerin type 1 [Lachnospiraceae bacterium]
MQWVYNMKHKRILPGIMILVLSLGLLAACSKETDNINVSADTQTAGTTQGETEDNTTDSNSGTIQTVALDSIEYDEEDYYQSWEEDSVTSIQGLGSSIQVDGTGATADGSVVTITADGTYVISGQIEDGQVIVDAGEEDFVRIILNGVQISNSNNAAIYGISAEKIIISLEDGTTNTLSDGEEYQLSDATTDEPNAALFSKTDITINGNGILTVDGNYNNGITSKDDLIIMSGTININAVDDALMGKDSVVIKDGLFTITAGGDGIKSTNDTDTTKGFIVIEGGTYSITAGADGIQAETVMTIGGGDYTIATGGGSVNGSNGGSDGGTAPWGNTAGTTNSSSTSNAASSLSNIIEVSTLTSTGGVTTDANSSGSVTDNEADANGSSGNTSAKALKAGSDIAILGGKFTIDSKDDSLHSNNNITISGGSLNITSGDDGIHADATISLEGGTIDISKSYEGIESAIITVDGGTIHVVSNDDGINVAGGNDSSSIGGRPGENSFQSTGTNSLTINNGYIYVNAVGDGLDANGSIYMNGGTVIVNGPTNSGNGSLDYDGEFLINGGTLVAAGSSGMAQTPGDESAQASIAYTFTQASQAGSLIHLEDADGTTLLTFAAEKDYQWILISSPDLKQDASYNLYSGGTATGDETDGLYANENYQGGTLLTEYTLTNMVTWLSDSGEVTAGAFNPGGGFGGKQGGARPSR